MSGTVVHLKPTNDAMVREVFGDAGFRNAEMLCELRLDGLTVARRATKQLTNGDAQSLAGFDIVIRRQIFVSENPYAGSGGSMRGIIELRGTAGEQAAKIHFQLGEARRETGIAGTSTQSGRGGGQLGHAVERARRKRSVRRRIFGLRARSRRRDGARLSRRGGTVRRSRGALMIASTAAATTAPAP